MEYFLDILKAILFGVVEGITEWLPISSTGHMIIMEQFLVSDNSQLTGHFFSFFLVAIQLGAIFAVIFNFFKRLWPFGKNISPEKKRNIWTLWGKIVIASIPAGVIGILFNDWMDEHLYNYLTVSITLIVYGVAFIAVESVLLWRAKKLQKRYVLNDRTNTIETGVDVAYPLFNIHRLKDISYQYAFIIGLAQCLALIPGTSRSGVTIIAALLLSIDRNTSATFSFFLSIPAMVGGSLVKAISYGTHIAKGEAPMITWFQVLLLVIAMVVAFIVSLIVIKWLMKLLKSKTFIGFGIYRIVLGIALIIILYTVNNGDLSVGVNTNMQLQTFADLIQNSSLDKAVFSALQNRL